MQVKESACLLHKECGSLPDAYRLEITKWINGINGCFDEKPVWLSSGHI